MRSFASDNWSGVCPEIMEVLNEVNKDHNPAYGELNDEITESAIAKFKEMFGENTKVFFVYNGTAANVLGIHHLIKSYHAVVAAHSSHINEDECGAPEKISGSKIYTVDTFSGKITPDDVKPFLKSLGFQHHSQPKLISISQVTEKGTVYDVTEIKELADFAHANGMFLHVDGARIANAAVSLGVDFKTMITDTGVDVLSFGGTKNGLMFGEAVVFPDGAKARDFEYLRKQNMQLHSKMRYIAAQFDRYLTGGLWKKNASQANNAAKLLESQLKKTGFVKITREVRANGVFAILPAEIIEKLREKYYFHIWDSSTNEVRLMCSWDTTEEDINGFISLLRMLVP